MAWPADKRFMTPEQFKAHVAALDFSRWRPIGIVIHNTAEPTLKRWHEVPRAKWMVNLESYYKGLGWNGGPHLFIDDGEDGIGLFNPLNARGTHSPSFNAQWIGIEHVGDYAREDDDAGPGLRVKMNGIAAMAILCARLGIDPTTHIKLHKEDPRTDHDCPGRDMAQDKQKTIEAVIEYMGEGGDHGPSWGHVVDVPSVPPGTVTPPAPVPPITGVTLVADLNLRAASSQGSAVLAVLKLGTEVAQIGAAKNGATSWLRVQVPSINKEGWVSTRFVGPRPTSSTSGPSTSPSPTGSPGSAGTTPPTGEVVVFRTSGKMSTFGGPRDDGMSEIEGLAIFETIEEAKNHGAADYFVSIMVSGASGLGRRLNVTKHYVACRWDYNKTSRKFLQDAIVWVTANGKTLPARAIDWGPNVSTGRAADLSPGLAQALGLDTDGTCTVTVYASGK